MELAKEMFGASLSSKEVEDEKLMQVLEAARVAPLPAICSLAYNSG